MSDEIILKIARKLREIRLNRNLTIQQVADGAKVTKGLLSKIENAKTIPSLPVFVQILHSLDLKFMDFFEQMTAATRKNYWLIRKNEYKVALPDGSSGIAYHQIFTHEIASAATEIYLLTVKPGGKGPVQISDGYKFKHLISGECEYNLDNKVLALEEGDSMFIQATHPYFPVNKSERDAVLLVVAFRS